jgi:hypothetical protein
MRVAKYDTKKLLALLLASVTIIGRLVLAIGP